VYILGVSKYTFTCDTLVVTVCFSDVVFSDATYQKMLAILAQCETTMIKSVEVYNMNLKEQENYEHLNERIGKYVAYFCKCCQFYSETGSLFSDSELIFTPLLPLPYQLYICNAQHVIIR